MNVSAYAVAKNAGSAEAVALAYASNNALRRYSPQPYHILLGPYSQWSRMPPAISAPR